MNRACIFRSLPLALAVAAVCFAMPQNPPAPPAAPQQDAPAAGSTRPQDTPVPNPLPQGTRIFLKDGNYLLVREYKVESDRVRYWSVERSAWEEIPTQMIDWDATHKGEAEDAARTKEIDQKLKDIATHERAASLNVDTSVEVAPNVYLPDEPGFWIIANGAVETLSQDLAESTLSKRRFLTQILIPIPMIPSKHSIDLKEAHAKLRVNDAQPEFYFRTADQREPNVALVRAEVRGKSRHIADISTLAVTGQRHEKDSQMLLERWVVARGTYRYTLATKLEPGEYAFVENVVDKGLELYVWDFGVDAGGVVKH